MISLAISVVIFYGYAMPGEVWLGVERRIEFNQSMNGDYFLSSIYFHEC